MGSFLVRLYFDFTGVFKAISSLYCVRNADPSYFCQNHRNSAEIVEFFFCI